MLSRRLHDALVAVCLLALAFAAPACEKVPLVAPSGSTITLTAATNALSANGTITIVAQVLEAAGTPPHSGTHVTFTTTLGRIDPPEVKTDVSGRATATFIAGGSNGTATITAVSGGATTGSTGAAQDCGGHGGRRRVVAQRESAVGSSRTAASRRITATVLDINGNALVGSPVLFTTTAGALSSGIATDQRERRRHHRADHEPAGNGDRHGRALKILRREPVPAPAARAPARPRRAGPRRRR